MEEKSAIPQLPSPLPKQLNLGCGWDRRDGFLNVDLHRWHNPDLVADITQLDMLPSDHFECIVAQDVLEHIERTKTVPVLREWARLLQPEGVIQIRVPDLYAMFERLVEPGASIEHQRKTVQMIFGTQAYTGDFHLAGFTPRLLSEQLREAGLLLCNCQRYAGWLILVTARKTYALTDPREIVHLAFAEHLDRPPGDAGEKAFARLAANGNIDAVSTALRGSKEYAFLRRQPRFLLPFADQIDSIRPPTFRSRLKHLRRRLGITSKRRSQ